MVGRGSGWQNSGIEKKIRNSEKNSRINQEMVNTLFLPIFWVIFGCLGYFWIFGLLFFFFIVEFFWVILKVTKGTTIRYRGYY